MAQLYRVIRDRWVFPFISGDLIAEEVGPLHTPNEVKPVAPKKVGHEPDCPEEPQLGITKEARHLYRDFCSSTELIFSGAGLYFIPDVPPIVLQYLVEYESAEV